MLSSDLFMDLLNNKEAVLKSIIQDLSVSEQNKVAFQKLEALFVEGKEVSPDKVMKACAKSLTHLNEVNMKLLMLLTVYVSGNNYDGDVGHILVKLGRGQEALQAMLNRKMGKG